MPAEGPLFPEARRLLDAVHRKYGYDLRGYAPGSMNRRVLAALAHSGLGGLDALEERLLEDPDLFATVLDNLTVRTSEMFRDPGFFLTFRQQVVPLLRTYPLVRIWLAGCAQGEEVYALCILLAEEGLADRVQLYATDLNPRALEAARRGTYPADRLAQYEENHRSSGACGPLSAFYRLDQGELTFDPELRRNVLFFHHDLVADQVFGEMHVVFCRNVLIYFGAALREQVLAKLAGSLRPGGVLCLGSSERLRRSEAGSTFAERDPAERIYSRVG